MSHQGRRTLRVDIPEAFAPLFRPARYKVFYGGRGGAKSWAFARALLILGVQKPLRILCARELQKSTKDSVYTLLKDQARSMGLGDFYKPFQTEIRGANGTTFGFEGLWHNPEAIKSYEGADICWVEEAQAVSRASWKELTPTIRNDGSEIWASFNPKLETDDTYQRFVINPPPNAIVRKVGWQDNPYFPDVLNDERLHCLATQSEDEYRHIWEGHCKQALEGAVYAKQIRAAEDEGRICRVPYDASKPVNTFWDLGWSDMTTIWFIQRVGFEHRIVDYYQNQREPLGHYLHVLQGLGYVYGTDFLPHDARAKNLGTGKSIQELMEAAGRRVEIVPALSVEDGINAARTAFGTCWFDRERCADGLQALRHYRYDIDEKTGETKRKPLHDWASHGADGFRYFAVASSEPAKARGPTVRPLAMTATSWMG